MDTSPDCPNFDGTRRDVECGQLDITHNIINYWTLIGLFKIDMSGSLKLILSNHGREEGKLLSLVVAFGKSHLLLPLTGF